MLLWRVASQASDRELVLYLWDPAYVSYIDDFPNAVVCYHLFDELTLYDGPETAKRTAALARALERADVVIAASEPLAEKYGRGREVRLCPNGVDLSVFSPKSGADRGERGGSGAPRLVFSGSLRSQIDVDAMDAIMDARPHWTLLLIGDVAKNVREEPATVRLLSRPNVSAVGRRDQHEVARLLADCDVALAPYRADGAASFCSPLKIPEYLAVGLPVVASPVAGAAVFGDCVHFATSRQEWLSQIEVALSDWSDASLVRRKALAAEFSWDSRVDQIREWLWHAQQRRKRVVDRRG